MTLHTKLSEDAAGGAVGGGAVGVFAMPLFATFAKRSLQQRKKPQIIKYSNSDVIVHNKKRKSPKKGLGLREAVVFEDEIKNMQDPSFDDSDVIAKLKSLEHKDDADYRDTTTFGLDDDDGKIIRVTVKNDQAEEFEKALQSYLADVDETQEIPEIAEILFDLKDKFDIVDIEWPEIAEDEEVDQQAVQPESGEQPADDQQLDGIDTAVAQDDNLAGDQTSDVSVLTQIIDMMKADAEARKADAEARQAEAKNKEAEAAVAQANARVRQEEQLLDMDTFNKTKREEEREAHRLAQLAQWKHQTSSQSTDDGDDFGLSQSVKQSSENEESSVPAKKTTPKPRVHPHEIARFLLNRMATK